MLAPDGRLGYICADRWMRNQYGAALRNLVTRQYAVDSIIVMHDVDAFEDEVSAYPAITVIRNAEQGSAKIVEANGAFDAKASTRLTPWLLSSASCEPIDPSFEAAELPGWFAGDSHWPAGSPHHLELVADLESRFSPLEDPSTQTRVGIGVATGCDDVYIVDTAPGVEQSRLLPLLTAPDIASGDPDWSGQYLINPWEDGRLVDLAEHPGLAAYLEQHDERIRGRYVARKRPETWYRTIDRVTPGLRERPKLVLPDIKAAAHPVLDVGLYYPHHNLYYVISDIWDLEVLGGLLLSDVANLLVGAYCVKMRGGTYRFQAQYVRKVRVPDPLAMPDSTNSALRDAFRKRDRRQATEAAASAYGLEPGIFQHPPPASVR